MKKSCLLALPLAGLLGGCASTPPPASVDPGVEFPASWSTPIAGIDSVDRDDWWRSFGSSSLDSMVHEALLANRTLEAAVANVDAALASARIAGADRWPQINGSARGSRAKQIFVGLPIPGPGVASSLSNNYALGVDASWEIDLWNRLGARERAALANLEAVEADLAAARLSIAAQVSRTWLQLTELQRQRELAGRTVDAYEKTEQIANDRYERGLIPSVDVYLTRTALENARALLALRENQRQEVQRRLEILLGRYPRGEVQGDDTLPSPPAQVPGGLPVDLVSRRPDLVAAERRVVAANARTSEARRNLLPRISLTASTGTTSNEVADLLDGDFSVWSLAGSLLQPIFQGGRLRAAVDLQSAGGDANLAIYAQATLNALGEVETALAAESFLAEREARLSAALEAASRAWSLAEDRYRQGVGDLLSVLEAQRRALTAESELITVRRARLSQRIDLYLAVGGGFDATTAEDAAEFLGPEHATDDSSPPANE